ncbi:MAG: PD-(D/E)XK nuclease family protein, partial [Oscillospiraceae bacterium]|nr:PD-(D/E)XK nuclease family protein [Oscillospiraceae bacterium]
VIDYKTSEKRFLPERLADGLDLQMLIYLFALEEMQEYGATTSPSAVLYMPSGYFNHYEDREKKKPAKDALHDYYRMKGLLLDSSLEHTEPDLVSAQTSVMKANSKDLFSINSEQMQNLKQYVYQKIYDMADKLYAGEIAPVPNLYNYGENEGFAKTPCCYCIYKDFCGKAETKTCERTAEEKQQALEAVFGKDTKGENQE